MQDDKDEEIFEADPDNKEMTNVLDLIDSTAQNIFLTGKAGTGKSTLMRHIKRSTHKRFIALAPTGIAALNVGGQTIHSFFSLPFHPLPPTREGILPILEKSYGENKRALIRRTELFIVDEVSMMRADIADAIDIILRTVCGRDLPFGGKQMLFIGDLFQLEPVVKDEDREILRQFYRDHFFFSAKVFETGHHLVCIELKKVYRQSSEAFIRILDNIRTGEKSAKDLAVLNERVQPIDPRGTKDFTVTLCPRRARVAKINDEHLRRIRKKIVSFIGLVKGDFPESAMPASLDLTLKAGAQVMFVVNDSEHRWVNGTIGVVETLDKKKGISVRLPDGDCVRVEPHTWENIKYRYNAETRCIESETIGYFVQVPLQLAWAVTIHKSQGLTFDRVVVDMDGGAFAGGQTYVALSRCRSLDGLTLSCGLRPRDIIVRREVQNFYRGMNRDSEVQSALHGAALIQSFTRAKVLWGQGEYTSAVTAFTEALAEGNIFENPVYRRLLAFTLHDEVRFYKYMYRDPLDIEA